jgi:hypothetical protein
MQTRWLPRVILLLVAIYLSIAISMGLRNTFLRLRVAAGTAGVPVAALRRPFAGVRDFLAFLSASRLGAGGAGVSFAGPSIWDHLSLLCSLFEGNELV